MMESDKDLLRRIITAYGMWGAFLSHAMECSGQALDECAKHVGLERRNTCSSTV